MENALLKKLKIKRNFSIVVINAPENFENIIGDLPDDIKINSSQSIRFDALLIFAVTKAEMIEALAKYQSKINEHTLCWICYPKTKTAIASDLNLMQSWDTLNHYNLSGCASAAIDGIWTAIRVRPSHATKKSGLANADIQKSDFANYIDVVNKTVSIPADFKIELTKVPIASSFFETLSYTNRKEYVLWILSSKRAITRAGRIQTAVQKLTIAKKNPSEK